METPESKFEFLRLARLDENCRCCGKGTKHICEKCGEKIRRGFSFIVEVRDNATETRFKPTGYAIAFKANQPAVQGTELGEGAGKIYLMRQSELKQLLGHDYNNYRTRGADKAKLISGVRKLVSPSSNDTSAESSSRQATELADK